MRKLIVSEFVSLDGVMEDPGGVEGGPHGGWTIPYWGDDIADFKQEELFASGALLLGRITYEGFAAAWPAMSDSGGFAERMNSLPKHVATRTLAQLDWNNSHALEGDAAQAVTRLKQQPGQDILLAGSAMLLQTLMLHELVDEYRLLIYPVVLGEGKRLFRDPHYAGLKLVESKPFSSGVVLLRYEPVWKRAAG
jgi:dihydrofolate reductase